MLGGKQRVSSRWDGNRRLSHSHRHWHGLGVLAVEVGEERLRHGGLSRFGTAHLKSVKTGEFGLIVFWSASLGPWAAIGRQAVGTSSPFMSMGATNPASN